MKLLNKKRSMEETTIEIDTINEIGEKIKQHIKGFKIVETVEMFDTYKEVVNKFERFERDLKGVETNIENVATVAMLLNAARQRYSESEIQYLAGTMSFQTWEDVEEELVSSEQTYLTSLRSVNIARTEVAMDRLVILEMRIAFTKMLEQESAEFVQRGSIADGDVVDLVGGFRIICRGSEQVHLDGVGDVTEVTAGFAIAIDIHRLVGDHRGDPFGDDRRVGAVGVLSLAEDIEVAQANGFESISAGEHLGIQLVHQLGNGIGRKRLADLVFHFRQVGMIAVGGTAGGIDEAADLGVARGNQHVEEAVDVRLVGGNRIFDRAWHAAERRLMQDIVDWNAGIALSPRHGLPAGFHVPDIAFDELEPGFQFITRPTGGLACIRHRRCQVVTVAGGEVVQPNHLLVQLEQCLQ